MRVQEFKHREPVDNKMIGKQLCLVSVENLKEGVASFRSRMGDGDMRAVLACCPFCDP